MNPLLILAIAALLQGPGQTQSQTPIPPGPASSGAPVPITIPAKYQAKSPDADAVVAKVDGQVIHAKDVDGVLWDAFGPQTAEDYINLVIIRRVAIEKSVTVTQAEVEQQVETTLKASDEKTKGSPQRPAGMPIEVYLARQGYPLSRIYLNSEIELTLDKIILKSFTPGSFIKLSVMAFKPSDQTASASTAASQRATAAAGKLKLGQKWSDLLKLSDNPPNFQDNDGLLGWVELQTMPAGVQKQLVGVKVGGTSQPVAISNVFEIFKVDALGATVTGPELDQLKDQYLQNQRRTMMTDLIAKAKIERFPVTEPGALTNTSPVQTPPKRQ